jgi:hypothetical protein
MNICKARKDSLQLSKIKIILGYFFIKINNFYKKEMVLEIKSFFYVKIDLKQ